MIEIVDAYDNTKQIVGRFERGQEIPGIRRLSVRIWFMNDKGEFLLQQRSKTKKRAPGMWGPAGGGALTGETSWDACIRESHEEFGIIPDKEKSIWLCGYKTKTMFVDVWLVQQNTNLSDIKIQTDEVDDVKWVSLGEINKMHQDGIFIPTDKIALDMIQQFITM